MKVNLRKLVTSLLAVTFLSTLGASTVHASEVVSNERETTLNMNQYTPSRIWITLGAYDNSPTHYFEYNGYRGYLSRVSREKVGGRGSMTLYRGYLYSREVRSIPTPYKHEPQLLKYNLNLENK